MKVLKYSIFFVLLAVFFLAGFMVKGSIKNPEQKETKLLFEAKNIINSNFLGDRDAVKLIEESVRGYVSGLSEPYSVYLSKKESKELDEELKGELSGIGAEIGYKEEAIVVISTIEKSPAREAGILSGDE